MKHCLRRWAVFAVWAGLVQSIAGLRVDGSAGRMLIAPVVVPEEKNPAAISLQDCKLVAAYASVDVTASSSEKKESEDGVLKVCKEKANFNRCDFFAEALSVAKANDGFKPVEFCERFVTAQDTASLMEEVLDSGSVKELAYGKCMLKRQDPIFCTNFHVQFHQALYEQEFDCLRTAYMLKLTREDSAMKTAVPMPLNTAGDMLAAVKVDSKVVLRDTVVKTSNMPEMQEKGDTSSSRGSNSTAVTPPSKSPASSVAEVQAQKYQKGVTQSVKENSKIPREDANSDLPDPKTAQTIAMKASKRTETKTSFHGFERSGKNARTISSDHTVTNSRRETSTDDMRSASDNLRILAESLAIAAVKAKQNETSVMDGIANNTNMTNISANEDARSRKSANPADVLRERLHLAQHDKLLHHNNLTWNANTSANATVNTKQFHGFLSALVDQ